MKMHGYFVWSVKGTYEWRSKPFDSARIAESTTRELECLVLTRDPLGRDVPALALEMRVGEQKHWDEYTPTITEMRCLGWAQGESQEEAEPRKDPR